MNEDFKNWASDTAGKAAAWGIAGTVPAQVIASHVPGGHVTASGVIAGTTAALASGVTSVVKQRRAAKAERAAHMNDAANNARR